MRPSAKINDTTREAFVHRHISFAGKRIFRMKAGAVAADAAFVAERGRESLSERDAAIFDGVMRVHLQIACAAELQIHDRVSGEEREHVVEERRCRF